MCDRAIERFHKCLWCLRNRICSVYSYGLRIFANTPFLSLVLVSGQLNQPRPVARQQEAATAAVHTSRTTHEYALALEGFAHGKMRIVFTNTPRRASLTDKLHFHWGLDTGQSMAMLTRVIRPISSVLVQNSNDNDSVHLGRLSAERGLIIAVFARI